MDWSDNAEQAGFREQVATFIGERLPQPLVERGVHEVGMYTWYEDLASEDAQVATAAREWADALAERGWVAPHWPSEYGGAGLTAMEQFIFNEEMAKAMAPPVGGSGVMLLGPTLLVHGTDEQKQKYLPKILSGETRWTQGYSEPGAGSDLGSLQTRATRDGDEFVVNGQKIWTSSAHQATSIFALVRTNPDAPKHRGISFLLIDDIHTPGLTVRPLIDMGWGHHVNETFFEDVRVPAQNVLGEENRGWYVGMTLLDFERSGISGAVGQRRDLVELLDLARNDARSSLQANPAARHRLADRAVAIEVCFQLSMRIASMQAAGLVPNYEASIGKMFSSEHGQELHRVGLRVFGLYANLWPGDPRAPINGKHTYGYIRSIPSTIGGGSSEIQRNIIATRGLGLPRG